MESILVYSAVIAAITAGLVQVIKQTQRFPINYIPLVSCIIGMALGGATVLIPELAPEMSIGAKILGGLISGLAATGAYEFAANRKGYTKPK